MKIQLKSKRIKNKFIYGELLKNNSKSMVLFLSGFSGGMESPLFKEATKIFFKNNYDVLKFNFCNDYEGVKRRKAIKLEEMSISMYSPELKNILDLLTKDYSRIVLVGHSFGAIVSILFLSNYPKYRKNTSLVLWEPALLPWEKSWMEGDFSFLKEDKMYLENISGNKINRRFYEELIGSEDTSNVFRRLKKRALIISATAIGVKNARKYYSKTLSNRSKLVVIDGADHGFSKRTDKKRLFGETINFLNNLNI